MDTRDYSNTEMRALIMDFVHSERDRALMVRRLIDGVGFERLGEEFAMSDKQVKRIVYRLQEQLFRRIT